MPQLYGTTVANFTDRNWERVSFSSQTSVGKLIKNVSAPYYIFRRNVKDGKRYAACETNTIEQNADLRRAHRQN